MAIYEYRCDECHKRFNVVERISEHEKPGHDRPKCPGCGGRKTRRLFSPFYAKTDSKS